MQELLTMIQAFSETLLKFRQDFILERVANYFRGCTSKIRTSTGGILDEKESTYDPKVQKGYDNNGRGYVALLTRDDRPFLLLKEAEEKGRYWLQVWVTDIRPIDPTNPVAVQGTLDVGYELVNIINLVGTKGHGLLMRYVRDEMPVLNVSYCTQVSRKLVQNTEELDDLVNEMTFESQNKIILIFKEQMKNARARASEFNCDINLND